MKLHIRPDTEYILGTDLSGPMAAFCQTLEARTVVICDQAVEEMGKKLGFEFLTFSGGEAAKTRETKQRLEDELLARKMGRDTLIVALGGGVTTDLVGFLASTYMRGVPLVLAPTTLLAMVDAAIGGKTGVDAPHGKNLIGAFYSPKAIFANLNALKTLPEKEWLNGLAEIWKAGLIADPRIWQLQNWRSHLLEAIELSARVKIDCVEKDFFERGLRRILNFGHTIGHAIEAVANYRIAHGEAVAIGTVVESYLSHRLGYLSKMEFEEIEQRYDEAGFSLKLPLGYDRKPFMQALFYDKKKSGKSVRFVLIDKIGHAMPFEGAYCRPISESELEHLLDWMEKRYG